MNSKLITEKIEQLIELAKLEDEPNVQIVLLALAAARETKDDGMLAGKVQEYVKDVLLPNAKAKRNNHIASQN